MSTKQQRPRLEEFQVEEDVDLSRVWRALAARWWLPVVGLLAGALIGYLASVGGEQVYRAQSTIYLGQPYSPNGNSQIQSVQTNASSVRQIVTSESVVQKVASMVGLRVGQLRGHVSTSAVSGNNTKTGQAPLVTITVTGRTPKKVRLAATALANTAVLRLSGYARAKIDTLRQQIATDDALLAELDRAARSGGDATAAVLAVERGNVQTDKLTATQLLAQAVQVESPRVLTAAGAHKVTARTKRSTIAVVALIGLLLGLVAALVWDPVAARLARRPRV